MRVRKPVVIFSTIIFISIIALTCLYYGVTEEENAAEAATETSGKWQTNGQTLNLIPEITSADTSWEILVEKGWGKDPNTPALQVHKTANYGYGIRPVDTGTDADIGNHIEPYGGIYYTIYLSEADRVKASLGQLSIIAYARYYLQANKDYDLTLRAEFHTENGTDIETKGIYVSSHKGSGDGDTQLTLEKTVVPNETAYIEMWFSNSKDGIDRPWIEGMQAYLYDSTAPQFNSVSLNTSSVTGAGKTPAVCVNGDSFSYTLTATELLVVNNAGNAVISVGGKEIASTSNNVAEVGGVTEITYNFTAPSWTSAQIASAQEYVTLSRLENYSITDQAGNGLNSSNLSSIADSLNNKLMYYRTMSVNYSLTHITKSSATDTANFGTKYRTTINAEYGYDLPESVTVSVGAINLATTAYTYVPSTGVIELSGDYITGDITITAAGVAKEVQVTFDRQSGTGGSNGVTATFNKDLQVITPPSRTGYTFTGYYERENGDGNKYYDENGNGVKVSDFVQSTTLYANWTANTYTVTYNSNKPLTASGTIDGTTAGSEHTYDTASPLTTNGYSLDGWTFSGWNTRADGQGTAYTDGQNVSTLVSENNGSITLYAVWTANTYTVTYNSNKPSNASGTIGADGQGTSYTDGQNVSTLVSENNGSITLYAVWTANTYTVTYNSNRPSNASNEVIGTTESSTHTYDTEKQLTANGYRLNGWTFRGWTTDSSGTKVYDNNQSVKNLTAENGETVTLYAVWTANTYTVTYNSNKPSCGRAGYVVYRRTEREYACFGKQR